MTISPLGRGGVPGLLQGLSAPASGLKAQKARIDTIALNLANAGTTAPPGEEMFQRRIVELEEFAAGDPARGRESWVFPPEIRVPEVPQPGAPIRSAEIGEGGVQIVGTLEDPTEGPLIYDPGHPHADERGYVRHSNVDPTREMVDLLEARRLFEANASVFEAMKSVIRRSIDI
jgi:flagellar basal-body rod protein FlgC